MSQPAEAARRADPFRTGEGTQGVFRVLLDAMARPGSIANLPIVDDNAPVAEAKGLAAIAQTLLDHEVTFAVVPGDRREAGLAADDGRAFGAYVRSVTGCREVPAREADYVLALGTLPPGLPASLRTGLPAYPDEAATLVSLVPPLDGAQGARLSLAGPGVRPGTGAVVPGWSPADLASLVAANATPPLGIDVILVDAVGRVLCIPRSTRIDAKGEGRTQEVANGLHRG